MTVNSKTMKEQKYTTRAELVERWNDHMKDDPTLKEVFAVFDPEELYIIKSRRGNTHLKWNQENNRYMDDCVWSHNAYAGKVPPWAYRLFEIVGVEKR